MRSIRGIGIALVAVLAGSVEASAGGFIDEFRVGAYGHDVSVLGHQKEKGVDIGAEILFEPFEILWNPRPVIGILGNSKGQTSQAYFGLTWTWDFAHSVFLHNDGFYVEGTLGGGVNNGKLNVTNLDEATRRKSVGSHILFREDVDIGYRFNATWSIALSYNHISNAGIAGRNEGINDLGARVGIKF